MHAGVGADAVVPDAAAAERALVEVPGDRRAVVGVRARGGRVRRGPVAPGVAGLREQGAGAGGAPVQVVRLVAPARPVGERVRRARLGRGQGDLSAVLGVADAVLDALVLEELLPGGRVRDDVQLVRGAVVLEAADDRLVGQHGLAARRPDHLADAVRGRLRPAERLRPPDGLLLGGGLRHGRGETGDLQRGVGGPDHVHGLARPGGGDHQVAAEHRQAPVRALVAGVQRAVGVLDDVLDDQLLLGTQAYPAGGGGRAGVGVADQLGALRGRELDRRVGRGDLAGPRRRRGRGGRAGLDGGGDQGGDTGEGDGGGTAVRGGGVGGASARGIASQH